MVNRQRQDEPPLTPSDPDQTNEKLRAAPDAPDSGKRNSDLINDYISLNNKIVQNIVDTFSFNNFYMMFGGVFKMMGIGPDAASSAGIGATSSGSAVPAMTMNLAAIEDALTRLMRIASRPKADGFADKEPLSDDIMRRLMKGYAYVNELLRDRVDLFTYGNSHHWLELNHIVLCGTTPERREQFRDHIAQTERRFYDDAVGGIGERMEWLSRHRPSGRPAALAAGIFLHVTSSPQLFIEGNRRTATLIASYALVSAGLPPIVLTERDYRAFFALTDGCKQIDRSRWDHARAFRRESGRLEEFIRETADRRYLVEADGAPAFGA